MAPPTSLSPMFDQKGIESFSQSTMPASRYKSAVSSSSSRARKHPEAKHSVVHNYHDYAQESDDPSKTPIRRRKGGVNTPFPIVLHRAMAQIERDGYGHIMGWQPHGRCFLIHKPKEFLEIILPRYFASKSNKLTSFQRQLNLYGFNRITRGRDAASYYHELFLRDREFLAKRMMRQRIKGTKIKGAANPDLEPNFYAMPHVGPLLGQGIAGSTSNDEILEPKATDVLSLRDSSCFSQEEESRTVSSDDKSYNFNLNNGVSHSLPTMVPSVCPWESPLLAPTQNGVGSATKTSDDNSATKLPSFLSQHSAGPMKTDSSTETHLSLPCGPLCIPRPMPTKPSFPDASCASRTFSAVIAPSPVVVTSSPVINVNDGLIGGGGGGTTLTKVISQENVSTVPNDGAHNPQEAEEDPADAMLMELHQMNPLQEFCSNPYEVAVQGPAVSLESMIPIETIQSTMSRTSGPDAVDADFLLGDVLHSILAADFGIAI